MTLSWIDHTMFIIIGVLMPLMALISMRAKSLAASDIILPPKKDIYYKNGLMLWIGAALVFSSWNMSNKPWDRLGMNWPIVDTVILIMVAAMVVIYVADTIHSTKKYNVVDEEQKEMMKILPSNWNEYGHYIFLAMSAGICEEIIFRGFIINYIMELLPVGNSASLAVVISSIIFAVSHIYQGWLSVLKIGVLALLFGGIFILSKSLLLVMIIHCLVDLISGAVVVSLSIANATNESQKHP